MGESSLTLDPGDDFGSRINRALDMAQLPANEPFELPDRFQDYHGVSARDASAFTDPFKRLKDVADEIESSAFEERVVVSSSEVTAEDREVLFHNSRGLHAARKESEFFIDFVLLAADQVGREVESNGYRRAGRLKELEPAGMVREYASFARDTLSAVEPPSGIVDVVFTHECLDTLFQWFVAQSGGPSAYHGWSRFREGEPVVPDPKGDRLTLVSDPFLAGGLKTRPFDENGLPQKRVEVIRDGIFQRRPVDKRHADYLELPATGAFANLVVSAGSRPLESLMRPKPVLQCVQFSTFEPNPISGAFSGEIRLGIWHGQDGSQPVKGGSVSGIMEQAFQEAYLSTETVRRETYLGPGAVKLCRLSVAGG